MGGDLLLRRNDSLDALTLPALVSLGQLEVRENDSLVLLSAPTLEEANLYISENLVLESVSLPKLTTVGDILNVSQNPALETLSFPSLVLVSENLSIRNLDALTSIDLPVLETVAWAFEISGNAALVSLSAPDLTAAQSFEVKANPSLPQCRVLEILARIQPAPSYSTTTTGNDEVAICND